MPIEKVVNLAPETDIIEVMEEMEPDIEIVLEDDGSATVEIDPQDDDVEFYSNLAEVMDDSEMSLISSDLLALFEADRASRDEWEEKNRDGRVHPGERPGVSFRAAREAVRRRRALEDARVRVPEKVRGVVDLGPVQRRRRVRGCVSQRRATRKPKGTRDARVGDLERPESSRRGVGDWAGGKGEESPRGGNLLEAPPRARVLANASRPPPRRPSRLASRRVPPADAPVPSPPPSPRREQRRGRAHLQGRRGAGVGRRTRPALDDDDGDDDDDDDDDRRAGGADEDLFG